MTRGDQDRVLIVFPDPWVAYSPTVLNLVDELQQRFEVRVLGVSSGLPVQDLPKDVFRFVRIPVRVRAMLTRVKLYRVLVVVLLLLRLLRQRARIIVGVDSVGLLVSQIRFGAAHLLSLEARKDVFWRLCRAKRILSVSIQTPERYDYLFPRGDRTVFYLPNAPARPSTYPRLERQNDHLVFFGNAIPTHGIFQCLEVMTLLPELRLTIKGIIPDAQHKTIVEQFGSLIDDGRVVVDSAYLGQDSVVTYLSQFAAGFCIYDLDLIDPDDFNYLSVPSGKLFNYYAAGVPVIGTKMLGLQSIEEYGAGVLISTLDPSSMADAVKEVLRGADAFRRGCDEAARDNDFAVRSRALVEHLDTT